MFLLEMSSSNSMIYIEYLEFKEIYGVGISIKWLYIYFFKWLYFLKQGLFVWYYSLVFHLYFSSLHFESWVYRVTPFKPRISCWSRNLLMGCLGGSVVERLPLAQGVIPGFWDRVLPLAPCREPAFPSACVSASLCLSWINKILKKKFLLTDEKYSVENVVSNSIITLSGDCTYCGERWVMYKIVKSLC